TRSAFAADEACDEAVVPLWVGFDWPLPIGARKRKAKANNVAADNIRFRIMKRSPLIVASFLSWQRDIPPSWPQLQTCTYHSSSSHSTDCPNSGICRYPDCPKRSLPQVCPARLWQTSSSAAEVAGLELREWAQAVSPWRSYGSASCSTHSRWLLFHRPLSRAGQSFLWWRTKRQPSTNHR